MQADVQAPLSFRDPRGIRASVAVVAVAAAVIAVFAGQSQASGSSHRNAARSAAAAKETSTNWSGYAVTTPGVTVTNTPNGGPYSDVTGTWTAPSITCTPGATTASAVWVGLGGYFTNSNALEQAGTAADCDSSGTPSYYAWYELVPANSVTVPIRINPGDVITTSVVGSGANVLVQIKDRTRNVSFTKRLVATNIDYTSAEWIVEAPSSCSSNNFCRQLTLSSFASVTFGKIAALANGQGGTLTANPGWTSIPINLVPQSRRFFGNVDSTSGQGAGGANVSTPTVDGRGFTATYTSTPGA